MVLRLVTALSLQLITDPVITDYFPATPHRLPCWQVPVNTMSKRNIALVTGGNRGIGQEIVRQLATKGWRVFLSARDPKTGARSASAIKGDIGFLSLDVADDESITQAAKTFGQESDHLDVLINNAAIYPDEKFNILNAPRALLTETFQTNTFGAIRVSQAFLPFLKRAAHARIVNLSSGYGEIHGLSANVPSYCLSKLTLNGATIMLDQALSKHGIAVNSMCPGWVRTDMGGPNASLSVEEGADTAVWLATEAPHSLSGKFFRNRREISW
jgi:NAD(P)-dependent dehydrogenase (short-subunit alcohol dehydrogenase family)